MKLALPTFVLTWFAADLVLALFPPLHWWASGGAPVLGAPRAVVYIVGSSAFIAASVVVAYLCDRTAGADPLLMDVAITFGALALFFGVVVAILQRSHVADRGFDDFTVAGRSFGGFAQAMAFFNTYQPGTVFLGAFGFTSETASSALASRRCSPRSSCS